MIVVSQIIMRTFCQRQILARMHEARTHAHMHTRMHTCTYKCTHTFTQHTTTISTTTTKIYPASSLVLHAREPIVLNTAFRYKNVMGRTFSNEVHELQLIAGDKSHTSRQPILIHRKHVHAVVEYPACRCVGETSQGESKSYKCNHLHTYQNQ